MMKGMRSRTIRFAVLSALLALPLAAETRENLYGRALPEGAILRIGQPTPSDWRMLGEMKLLPGGRTIVVAGDDGWIRVCDVSTGVVLRKMGPQPGHFWREMSLSSNGKVLAAQPTYAPESIHVWDLESGKLLREVPRGEWISDVALSPDGSVLAWGNMKTSLKLVDVESGEELPVPDGAEHGLVALGMSADGRRLVVSGVDDTIRLFDLRERRLIRAFKRETLAHAAISPDGRRLVMSWTGRGHHVEIRDESGGWNPVALAPDCSYRAVISPDGRWLATGSAAIGGDAPIQVWDLAGGASVSRLNSSFGCDPPVFSPDGAFILAHDGGKLRAWDAASGTELESTPGHTGRAYFVSWSEDGRSILSVGAEGSIRRWDAASGEELSRIATPGGSPYLSGYLPIASLAGNRLALSEDNSIVSIWTLDSGKELKELVLADRDLRGMALSPDGKRLASESDGTLIVRDVASGDVRRVFREPVVKRDGWSGGSMRTISQSYAEWSPDGRVVAWSDRSGKDHLCDCDSGEMRSISVEGTTTGARFSPDGKRLLVGTSWRRPAIVNVETGQCETDLDWACEGATALAWSPDGRHFAAGENRGLVTVCDAATGKAIRRFQGSSLPVRAVAFSPKGDRLATAGEDGAIYVWDLGEVVKPPAGPDFDAAWRNLRAPNGPSSAAAFTVFSETGDAGVEELARRLDAELPPGEAGRWILELDSEDPRLRAGAMAALDDAGVLVESALKTASGTSSAEAGAAIHELQARLTTPLVRSRGSLRRLRSLQIIEAAGTPRSKEVLTRIAGRSTSEAERCWATDCLKRLR